LPTQGLLSQKPNVFGRKLPARARARLRQGRGFASNYAQPYEAIDQADSSQPDEPYRDAFWGVAVPNSLPARGAKLVLRANYGFTFAQASSGAETNSTKGIIDCTDRDVLEQAPQLETWPGVTRRIR
jgi:hypothetical protein